MARARHEGPGRGRGRGRWLALGAVWVGPTAALLLLAWAVSSHFRIDTPRRLAPEARAQAMAALRAALDHAPDPAPAARLDDPQLDHPLPRGGPVVVSLWSRGARIVRVAGQGDRVADGIRAAARALASNPKVARIDPDQRAGIRIQVNVIVGRGPVLRTPQLLSLLTLEQGIEGLGAVTGREEVLLMPDELVKNQLLSSHRPLPAFPDLKLGFDVTRADPFFALLAHTNVRSFRARDPSYFRFRTDSFVEPRPGAADRTPLPLTRGIPPGPALSAHALRGAAVAGARYLVQHLSGSGRYVYEVDLATGRATDPARPRPYSLPRHAGVTYFLAQVYAATHDAWLREPIERAFRQLALLVDKGGCTGRTPAGADYACVTEPGDQYADLGSTALTVVALCQYRDATGDTRYDQLTRRLATWILYMQRPDGSFAHLYDVGKKQRDQKTQLLYYSGEAALALVRLYRTYHEPRYLDAAHRALDSLVGWYDFFAGGFFFGEEHWTCIAAEAAWPALKDERYREFCDSYGAFLRRQQAMPDDGPDVADLAGTYGVTPFVVPHNTPVGSRTEAMISAYLLDLHHGVSSAPLRRQILRSMRYALAQQIRADNDFGVAAKAHGLGAIPGSPVDPVVRIDYVQHVCSAMLRAAALFEGAPKR